MEKEGKMLINKEQNQVYVIIINLCIHLPPPPTGTPPSRRRRIEDRTDYHLAQNRAEMSYTVWT